jgi:tetratricopeptide (TPR) repeat protein
MYNLGCAYGRANRFQEAIQLLQNSFEMRQRILSADHPDHGNEIALDQFHSIICDPWFFLPGDSMTALGTIYCSLNRRSDAVSMLTRALEFRMRVLPAGDPSIAQTQFLLSSVTMLNGI